MWGVGKKGSRESVVRLLQWTSRFLYEQLGIPRSEDWERSRFGGAGKGRGFRN